MRIVQWIVSEFFRSFRKSLFRDICLMCIFCIGLIMAVLMGSYYLDLGEGDRAIAAYTEKGTWYSLSMEEDEWEKYYENFTSVKGCRNVMSYYESMQDNKTHPLFSMATYQSVNVRKDEWEPKLGDTEYERFLDDEGASEFQGFFGEEGNPDAACEMWTLKSAQFDEHAWQMLGLRVVQGEGFTRENMTLEKASDPMPVVLGYSYHDLISVGDAFEIEIPGRDVVCPCRVAGILGPSTQVPEYASTDSSMLQLDSYVLLPYGVRVIDDESDLKHMQGYAGLDFLALRDNSKIQIDDTKEFRQAMSELQTLAQQYAMPALRMEMAPMGLNLLRTESVESVRIMLVLTLVILIFMIYGLFVTFYDKAQSNQRIYGIYLMNGCPLGAIIAAYLLEVGIIIFPSILACRYFFTEEHMGWGHFDILLKSAYLFAGAVFVIGAVIVAILMRGMDTEHMVRREKS